MSTNAQTPGYNDAAYHAEKRAAGRDVQLSIPLDLKRRRACLDDPFEFMRSYYGWIFRQPFTEQRKVIVERIIHAATYSGNYALAAERGGGKTGLALFTSFWLDIKRIRDFPIIIGKNQAGAINELSNLKQAIMESPEFAADFPEIALPILAIEDWASAARKQTVAGQRTKIGWEKDCLFLPTVTQEILPSRWPDSEPSYACGQGYAVVGIDGKIRGFKRRNRRPNMALIDDIDDRESARSEAQTKDHIVAIDQDIAGLGESGSRIPCVMPCTTINDTCVAAIYTAKPSWNPSRFKAIEKMPDREDLRDEYIKLRAERDANDPDARVAHAFYLANRDDIERGGVVGNPHNFISEPAADGDLLEVSAFQHYFNIIADTGWTAFLCEYQQAPPDSKNSAGLLMLTASHIQHGRLSGLERMCYPIGTVAITIGGDVQKLGLHWVAIAWNERGAGTIVAYDFFEFMTKGKKAADCELLILEGLLDWRECMSAAPFRGPSTDVYPDGEPRCADLSLIDMGWKEDSWTAQPVELFCSQSGPNFMPSKGMASYHQPKPSRTVVCGDNWHAVLEHGLWKVHMNTDHYKLKVHEGFMADAGEPGSLLIHNQKSVNGRVERTEHLSYAHHITSERWDMLRKKWTEPTKQNHYLDGTYAGIVGRSIRGINVFGANTQQPEPVRRPAVISAGRPNNYSRW